MYIILDPSMEIEIGQVATFYFTGEGQTLPAGGEYTADGAEIEAPVGRAAYMTDVKTPSVQ